MLASKNKNSWLGIKYKGEPELASVKLVARRTLQMRCTDGYRRVPNVNANLDGDFNWNLDNLENVWNDNNAFFSFCNF